MIKASTFILFWLLGCAALSFAQAETATLSGTVTDRSGAVVPGAQVRVTNSDTNVAVSTTTNASGIYFAASLRPGRYRMTVAKEGFKQIAVVDIVLNVQDVVTRNLTLDLGAVSDSVTVNGEAVNINATDAAVGTVIDRQFVANMPLNGRSFQSLISLTPSVVITSATTSSQGQFSVNGQRPDANYFSVDGVSASTGVSAAGALNGAAFGAGVQSTAGGGYNNLVSLDAMQEFKVETSSYAPQYGRQPGGQVAIVTRSGTNQVHGAAFDYLRNTSLDANNWFANRAGLARAPEHQNDFGGVVGGPIVRDRLFFFASYEGLRLTQPQTLTEAVPSLCARGGGGTSCPPATVAVAVMQPLLNLYPVPTQQCVGASSTCDPNTGTFTGNFRGTNSLNATSLRMDWRARDGMNFFVRGNDAPSNGVSQLNGQTIFNAVTKTMTAGYTQIVSNAMSNDLRFNFSYSAGVNSKVAANFGGAIPPAASVLFPPAFNADQGQFALSAKNLPAIRVGLTVHNDESQWTFVDTFTVVHGAHQMNFGFDYRRLDADNKRGHAIQYTYSLATSAWIQDIPNQFLFQSNLPAEFSLGNYSFFAQDSWRATPRLTVTYGVRWDVNPAPGSPSGTFPFALNQIDYSNLAATQVQPNGTRLYPTERNAFAPRLGIAWQLSSDPRWGRVLRAGFGVFFDAGGDALGSVGAPVSGTVTVTNPLPFPQNPATVLPAPQTSAPFTQVVATVYPNLRLPYTYETNLAFQQALGSSQSLTITYAGAFAHRLFLGHQFASPNATLPQGFTAVGDQGTSSYHSLQAQFQRRLSHGLQAMASYAWAHSIDTGSNPGEGGPNPGLLPIASFRGNSDWDIRHSLQTGISYNIPAPIRNSWLHAILANWGSDFIFRVRGATPVNLTNGNAVYSAFVPLGQSIVTQPQVVSGVPFYLYGPQYPGGRALNPAAFTNPPGCSQIAKTTTCQTNNNGNLSRNALRGFGWNQVDLTLRREFPLHVEGVRLQVRADFFNILNHANFAFDPTNGSLNTASPLFGVSSLMLNTALGTGGAQGGFSPLYQIGGSRSGQLSLKVTF